MIIRYEQPEDAASVRTLLEAAFAGKAEAQLVEQLRADGDLLLALVAEWDGKVAGHIAFSRLAIEGDPASGAVALAPVAVLPHMQRKGIGTSLVERGLHLLKQQGETLVFVLGDPGYYGCFGFDLAAAAGFSSPYDGPYFQALRLSDKAPEAGRVVYAPAFSAL